MLRGGWLVGFGLLAMACGGSSTNDGGSSTGGVGANGGAGAGATGGTAGDGGAVTGGSSGGGGLLTGGSSGVGGSSGAGGLLTGGTGGSSGSGGLPTGGTGGVSSGGTSGTGGSGGFGWPKCEGRSYCDCVAEATCAVSAEACFCPCGAEPCAPNCTCACGGGKYLGCVPGKAVSPDDMVGIWLIGWSGGLNHYSWVRLNSDFSADFLDGAGMLGNAPWWPCSGKGSWQFTAKISTFSVSLPAACGSKMEIYSLDNMKAPVSYPKGALYSASAENNVTMQILEAYKFPAAQCNASMTSCTDPL